MIASNEITIPILVQSHDNNTILFRLLTQVISSVRHGNVILIHTYRLYFVCLTPTSNKEAENKLKQHYKRAQYRIRYKDLVKMYKISHSGTRC